MTFPRAKLILKNKKYLSEKNIQTVHIVFQYSIVNLVDDSEFGRDYEALFIHCLCLVCYHCPSLKN